MCHLNKNITLKIHHSIDMISVAISWEKWVYNFPQNGSQTYLYAMVPLKSKFSLIFYHQFLCAYVSGRYIPVNLTRK